MCNCPQCEERCFSCEKPLEPGEGDEYCDYCAFCRPPTPKDIAGHHVIATDDPDELPF